MNKRVAALILMISLILTGCLAGKSPDQYGYAIVIGVDEGEAKPYHISMLIQRGGEKCEFVGVECSDLFEASVLLESALPYSINLSRASALIFSLDAAKSGLMAQMLSVSLGSTGIRHYANLTISTCRAEDYLIGLQGEGNIAKYQYSIVEYGEETGMIPAITLSSFYAKAYNRAGDVMLPLGMYTGEDNSEQSMEQNPNQEARQEAVEGAEDGQEQAQLEGAAEAVKQYSEKLAEEWPGADILGSTELLPNSIMRSGGTSSGVIGSAVFRGSELAGVLNGEHTQAVLIATGQFKNCRMRINIGGEETSVLLNTKSRPRVELFLDNTLNENSKARITVNLYASIEETFQDREAAERQIGSYIENLLKSVYIACRDKGADVFLLGKEAVEQFSDTEKWEAYDWARVYADLETEFTVVVTLKNKPSSSRME